MSNRSDSECVEIVIERWKLNESTAKAQSTARKVLGLLRPLAQRRLTRAVRLQVVVMPSADRAVWAYFPIYLTRRIAPQGTPYLEANNTGSARDQRETF